MEGERGSVQTSKRRGSRRAALKLSLSGKAEHDGGGGKLQWRGSQNELLYKAAMKASCAGSKGRGTWRQLRG